jgi:hypothetical protein
VPEQIMEAFRQFAANIFETYGEPKTLALVVDWEIGKTDFPAGMLINRKGTNLQPEDLLELNTQIHKFGQRLIELYGKEIYRTMQGFTRLRAEVDALEQRKRELTGEGSQGAVKPAESPG